MVPPQTSDDDVYAFAHPKYAFRITSHSDMAVTLNQLVLITNGETGTVVTAEEADGYGARSWENERVSGTNRKDLEVRFHSTHFLFSRA